MSFKEFSEMRLVGGTALALQIGHRISIDLDFFGKVSFDEIDINKIFKNFDSITSLKKSKNINIFEINGIKVDFVNYSYPWLEEERYEDNIRLAKIKDIAAMKIAAITGRGSKKDFIDLYFLLKKYDLKKIISFFEEKYFDANPILALKSLSYFEDADKEPDCNMIIPTTWETAKSEIRNKVKNYFEG